MRKLIAGMKITVDGKFGGADGYAHWVEAWSEDYGVTGRIDACILGAGMYPGYENYWTAVQHAGDAPLPMTQKPATAAEMAWSAFASRTPHYVLSQTLHTATWPHTKFIRNVDAIKALKKQQGKDIYLIGGAKTLTSLLNIGLVDELHLIVYPLIAGEGVELFSALNCTHTLELLSVRTLDGEKIHFAYQLNHN